MIDSLQCMAWLIPLSFFLLLEDLMLLRPARNKLPFRFFLVPLPFLVCAALLTPPTTLARPCSDVGMGGASATPFGLCWLQWARRSAMEGVERSTESSSSLRYHRHSTCPTYTDRLSGVACRRTLQLSHRLTKAGVA